MSLIKILENDRRNMLPQVRQLCDEVDAALVDIFEVNVAAVAPEFRGNTKLVNRFGQPNTMPLERVVKHISKKEKTRKDPRDITVKFDRDQKVTKATEARLQAIENYRKQIESDSESISYLVNEDKQYNAMLSFCKVAVSSGMLTEEDFLTEE